MRNREMKSTTIEWTTACGSLYTILTFDADGKFSGVLSKLGKSGGCSSATLSGLCSLATEGLRAGADGNVLSKSLLGVQCYQASPTIGVLSCVDALGRALEEGMKRQASGEMKRVDEPAAADPDTAEATEPE